MALSSGKNNKHEAGSKRCHGFDRLLFSKIFFSSAFFNKKCGAYSEMDILYKYFYIIIFGNYTKKNNSPAQQFGE